jgi:hypothetical protein
MKYQMIRVLEEYNSKHPCSVDKHVCAKSAFDGIDLTNCSSNEFAIKNGWRKTDVTSIFGESFSSFEVAYGFDYNRITCKACKSIVNSPLELKTCVVCDSTETTTEKKHIKKPVIQESIGFNADLFKQSVKDIEEHPVKTEPSIDWQHLADTIGD